jgi:hypothetical protein
MVLLTSALSTLIRVSPFRYGVFCHVHGNGKEGRWTCCFSARFSKIPDCANENALEILAATEGAPAKATALLLLRYKRGADSKDSYVDISQPFCHLSDRDDKTVGQYRFTS